MVAPLVLAGIGAAGSIGSSLIGSMFGASAAKKQLKLQKKVVNRQLFDAAPYKQTGYNALSDIAAAFGLGDFAIPDAYGKVGERNVLSGTTEGGAGGGDLTGRRDSFMQRFYDSPLYQMTYQPAIEAGERGIGRFASASGQLNSGGTLKALQKNASTIGGNTIREYLASLFSLAGSGQDATANTSGSLGQFATGATQAIGAKGDALTAGALGVGSGINNALSLQAYLKGLGGTGSSAYATGNSIY